MSVYKIQFGLFIYFCCSEMIFSPKYIVSWSKISLLVEQHSLGAKVYLIYIKSLWWWMGITKRLALLSAKLSWFPQFPKVTLLERVVGVMASRLCHFFCVLATLQILMIGMFIYSCVMQHNYNLAVTKTQSAITFL